MKAKTDFETHWSWKKLTGRPESPNFTIEIPAMPTKEDIANLHKKINHDRKVLHSRIDGLAELVQDDVIEWDDTPSLDQFAELDDRVKMLEAKKEDTTTICKVCHNWIYGDDYSRKDLTDSERIEELERRVEWCNKKDNWIMGVIDCIRDQNIESEDKIKWLTNEAKRLEEKTVSMHTINGTIDWIKERFEKIEKKLNKKPKSKIDIKEKFKKFLDKRNCGELYEEAMRGEGKPTDVENYIDCFDWENTNEGYLFWEDMNEEWLKELKKMAKKK